MSISGVETSSAEGGVFLPVTALSVDVTVGIVAQSLRGEGC